MLYYVCRWPAIETKKRVRDVMQVAEKYGQDHRNQGQSCQNRTYHFNHKVNRSAKIGRLDDWTETRLN